MDVLEPILCNENEEQSHRSLINLESSSWWLKPYLDTLSVEIKKNGGDYDSFLEVEDDSPKKVMETLTPKGVFIRFRTKFK